MDNFKHVRASTWYLGGYHNIYSLFRCPWDKFLDDSTVRQMHSR